MRFDPDLSGGPLPGFMNAAPNSRLIHNDVVPDVVRTLGGDLVQPTVTELRDLGTKREYAKVLGKIDLASVLEAQPAANWDVLYDQSVAPFESSSLPSNLSYEQRERTQRAARAAIAIMIALPEVMPRVAVHRELTEPDKFFADYAYRSFRMLIIWSTLSNSTDAGLHHALLSPKPIANGLDIFKNNRFHPRWFVDNQEDDRLDFNISKLTDLRIDHPMATMPKLPHKRHHRSERHPSHFDSPDQVEFGCPAGPLIRTLYRTMIDKAANDQLFSQTYHAARAEIGYEE